MKTNLLYDDRLSDPLSYNPDCVLALRLHTEHAHLQDTIIISFF